MVDISRKIKVFFFLKEIIEIQKSCLDTEGKVFDYDKFIWLQGRQVWMFSKLYNHLKQLEIDINLEQYLKIAKLGAEFLRDYAREAQTGYFYFAVDRKNKPLVAPFSIFSDCFAGSFFFS